MLKTLLLMFLSLGLRSLFAFFALSVSASTIAAESALYVPPATFLPAILAEFPGGKVTAQEFRTEVRAQLAAVPEPDASAILRQTAAAAEADMAAFAKKTPTDPTPMGAPKLYGWGAETVFSVRGRDFPWQEAVDFYLRAVANPAALQLLLTNQLNDKIVSNEAHTLAPDAKFPAGTPASTRLRAALAPLFTPEALTAFYQKNRDLFMVLKIAMRTAGQSTRTIYVAAGEYSDSVPITAYGVDYRWDNGVQRSPLTALPPKTIDALCQDAKNTVVDENTEYHRLEKLYPRQPARILPIIADIRLRQEIARLLAAVTTQAKVYHFASHGSEP